MLAFTDHPEGVVFKIFVQPRSSVNTIVGLHGDALKIRLTAPPVDGLANKLCIQFLAKRLGVPKSAIEIVAGHTGRTKQVLLRDPEGSPSPRNRIAMRRRVNAMAPEK